MHSQSIEPARSSSAEPLQSASSPWSATGVETPAEAMAGCGIMMLMRLQSREERCRYNGESRAGPRLATLPGGVPPEGSARRGARQAGRGGNARDPLERPLGGDAITGDPA